jgi:hypothetical protein
LSHPARPSISRPDVCRPSSGRHDPAPAGAFLPDRFGTDRLEADPCDAERFEAEQFEADRLEADLLDADLHDPDGFEADRLDDDPIRLDFCRPELPTPDLQRLIDDLDGHGAGPSPSAFLARATTGTWSITPGPPLNELVGWTAPPDCDAIGILAAGSSVRAVPLPRQGAAVTPDASAAGSPADDSPIGPGGADRGIRDVLEGDGSPPVRLIAAVDRFGRSASRLTVGDVVSCEPPGGGRMLDTLLRCLGRPTPPPAEDTAGLLSVLWFSAIIEHGGSRPQPLTWTETVRLHPASQLLLASGAHFSHRELAATADAAVRTLTWEILKDAAVWRDTLGDLCPGPLAAWMDAGMYSRWVLGQLPDLESLCPLMVGVLRPSSARHLADHVAKSLQGGCEGPPDQATAP